MNILEYQTWKDEDWLSYVKERLSEMRVKKKDWETKFRTYEEQNSALSFYDNEGNLFPNVPLEKTLGEIYMGRSEGKVTYDIVPDGQADVDELQPSKFALGHFLDGNERENFWKENRLFRDQKKTYGTGIWYTGLRSEKDFVYELKEKNKEYSAKELMDEKNYTRIENERWLFFPQTIHPMDFYVDDKAYGQPDVQYAEDCIRKEKISQLEYDIRYNNKNYLKTTKDSGNDVAPKNDGDVSTTKDEVILHHYYHRVLKKYIIMKNESEIVLNGLFFFGDGKLPFVTAHHYFRSDRFWGEGIPERVGYLKAYKSEILMDILSGAGMASGIHIIASNDAEIGQDWSMGGRQMNVWRTTGGAEKVQQMNTNINLGFFTAIYDLIDRQVAIDSGVNPNEQIEPVSDKVGIAEMMEANKSIRNRSVDEGYNIALDEALTQTLSLIKTYAPSVLKTEIKDSDGKTLKITYQPIRIDNYEVEKKGGKQVIKEAIGKYGYFELKPGTIMGSGVKVTTPSTNSLLPILERQKVNEYLDNVTKITNIAQIGGPDQLQKVYEFFDMDQVIGWMSDAYGYDTNGLKSFTEKDKLKKEVVEKMDKLKGILTQMPNETLAPTLSTPSIQPDANTPIGQEMGGSPPGVPTSQSAVTAG